MTLTTVHIETLEGVTYVFPDMDKDVLERIMGNELTWKGLGALTLVNISGACLVVPTRIIKMVKAIDHTPDLEASVWTVSAA